MVIIYTMAYNAEKTLPHTIQSVLDQTEPDWIWYLLDNGAQDATGKIIGEYAAKDPRIIPLRNEKNLVFSPETSFLDLPQRHSDTDWFCFLDADDVYTPDFLGEMLAFASKYHLDTAACGFDFVDGATGKITGQRVLPQDMILDTPEEFDLYFPVYHQFMRTNWAKLFSIKVVKQLDIARFPSVFYGTDTLYTQEMLRNSRRFGILAKSLHRYYLFPRSLSYQWEPSRIQADQILHRLACSYLIDKCGHISSKNRNFLQAVYSNAVSDTVNVIQNSALSPADKLREYRGIAENPITLSAYRECTNENAAWSRLNLLGRALEAGADLNKGDNDSDLRAVAQTLLRRCGQTVTAANATLFLTDQKLLQAFIQDDADALLTLLLERFQSGREIKKYTLLETIQALAADQPLLCWIEDSVFLRKYGNIYQMVFQGNRLSALDEMTGLLLENKVSGGLETFLTLFISLAAMEEQVQAFVFGKLRLADLYLRQNRREECRVIVADMTKMGVESEELNAIRSVLEK